MPTHINTRYEEIEALMPHMRSAQSLAEEYKVRDISMDAGLKMLQLAIATGIDLSEYRTGPDGFDRVGNVYEVKTADISQDSVRGFSTANRLNLRTIEGYRKRRWICAIYDKITMLEVYRLEPVQMEPHYLHWTERLKNSESLNNPKIPLDFVRRHGTVMYLKDVPPDWALSKVA